MKTKILDNKIQQNKTEDKVGVTVSPSAGTKTVSRTPSPEVSMESSPKVTDPQRHRQKPPQDLDDNSNYKGAKKKGKRRLVIQEVDSDHQTGISKECVNKGIKLETAQKASKNQVGSQHEVPNVSNQPNVEKITNFTQIDSVDNNKSATSSFAPAKISQETSIMEVPTEVGTLRAKAKSAFSSGQYGSSLEHYSQVLDILSSASKHKQLYADVLNNRAACYLKLGNDSDCIKDCNDVLKLDPKNSKALLRRATALEHKEKFSLALADYRSVLEIYPANVQAQNGRQRTQAVLRSRGSIDSSISKNNSGGNDKSRSKTVKQLQENVTPEQIERHFDKRDSSKQKLETVPGTKQKNAVHSHTRKKEESKSSSKLTPKVELTAHAETAQDVQNTPLPSSTQQYQKRYEEMKAEGNALVKKGKYLKAIDVYNQCIKLDPSNVAGFNNRAFCWLKLNENNRALADALVVLHREPQNIKGWFRSGLAHRELGDLTAAYRAFTQARVLDPNNVAAQKELSAILSKHPEITSSADVVSSPLAPNDKMKCTTNDQSLLKQTLVETESVRSDAGTIANADNAVSNPDVSTRISPSVEMRNTRNENTNSVLPTDSEQKVTKASVADIWNTEDELLTQTQNSEANVSSDALSPITDRNASTVDVTHDGRSADAGIDSCKIDTGQNRTIFSDMAVSELKPPTSVPKGTPTTTQIKPTVRDESSDELSNILASADLTTRVVYDPSTPAEFMQLCIGAVKRDNAQAMCDLLMAVKPSQLPSMFSSQLEANELALAVRGLCLSNKPVGAFKRLRTLAKTPRFDMTLEFLDDEDLEVIQICVNDICRRAIEIKDGPVTISHITKLKLAYKMSSD